jgi:hypothetical protein
MREADFDLQRLVPKSREVVQKYGIKCNRETPVPMDDAMADAVFEAAVEFFLEVGCFVKGNNRVIEFTRQELDEALEAAPSEVLFGEGRDARLAKHRTVEDPSRPLLWMNGVPTPQDLYFPVTETVLSNPLCDISGSKGLAHIDGVEIGVGDATEYFGATRMAQMLVEARRRVGRPGLPILNQTACGVTAIGMLAALEYLSPRDGYFVATISELRLDPDRLLKAAILQEWNANIGFLFCTLYGAMAGGPETSAVINVANWFLGALAVKSSYYSSFPLHMMGTNSTHREVMWAANMSGQAIARNTNFVSFGHIYTRHGPRTALCIYESVAALLGIMASGYNPSFVCFAGDGKTNRTNPLDVHLVAEVALATIGMSRQKANELCLEFLDKYEDKLLPDQDLGKTFPELYDVETRQPLPETVEHYKRMKDELADIGIPFTS